MGFVRNGVRIRLLAAAAITAMAIATPVRAQEGQRREYNVEAQNLGDALRTVSRLSGREVIFTAEAVEGKSAPRLRGTYTPDEAVRMLLDGSGLTAEFRKDVVLIRGRSATPGEVEDAPAAQSEILVTGSRIRGAQSTSPVITRSRDEMLSQGQTDLGAFARSLPQNFSGGQNPGIVGGGQGGSENTNGSSAMNLRGLGPDATLTLINGHRVAYDAVAQGVDISAIPLAAVDRVEVVADGASALYGSDAVGGVANVILRRDFDGLVTSARLSGATDGGDFEQQYSGVAGRRWAAGGILGTFDYRHSTAITAGQRSYSRNIDPSAFLLPWQDQISLILAGRQQVSENVVLEIDSNFSHRNTQKCTPFLVSASCRTNGALNDSSVRSFYITPTIQFRLPAGWDLRVSGTHSQSDTKLLSRTYAKGLETAVTRPNYNNAFRALDVAAEGRIFTGPAGDIRLAAGAGYRSVKIDVDSRRTAAGVTRPVYLFTKQRNVVFAYGELSVPIVGPENSGPIAQKLRFTGAVRYEEYQGLGDVATPKLGVYYEPVAGVSLKGSWGKSFKAPTLFQEGQISTGFLASGSIFTPPTPGGKPLILLSGGNPDLRPERATTWTTTVTLAPEFAEGLSLEASYFNVEYRDRVASPVGSLINALGPLYADLVTLNPSTQQVEDFVAGLPGGLTNQSDGPYDPSAVGAIVDNRLQNVARQSIRGLDFSVAYAAQLGGTDHLSVSAAASYIESDQRLSIDQPTTQKAGTIFDPPHWRGRATATWERPGVAVTGVATYIGGTIDDRVLPKVGVSEFVSFDAVARFSTRKAQGLLANLDFTFSVLNLLNEKPSLIRPIDPAAARYDSTNYSAVGRSVSVTIAKRW